ncbi:hypothetical protein SARC_10431, partial [Sphaeroforma arctica JP610]
DEDSSVMRDDSFLGACAVFMGGQQMRFPSAHQRQRLITHGTAELRRALTVPQTMQPRAVCDHSEGPALAQRLQRENGMTGTELCDCLLTTPHTRVGVSQHLLSALDTWAAHEGRCLPRL